MDLYLIIFLKKLKYYCLYYQFKRLFLLLINFKLFLIYLNFKSANYSQIISYISISILFIYLDFTHPYQVKI